MEGLSKEGENTYKQFNKTLFISAAFFLTASFLLFVIAHVYIGCKVKNGKMGDAYGLVKTMKPFVIGYGLLILGVFIHSRHEWQSMIIPIIPFAFVNLIVNVYADQVAEWKEQDRRRFGTHRLNFLIEVPSLPSLDRRIFVHPCPPHHDGSGRLGSSHLRLSQRS